MDLIKLDKQIPIKSIPEQELNTIILTQFTVWVANLLSLTDETSANRLEIALPAIKEHCWSMGFAEIKKMFEMYVDGKLSIKPLPNYFDRILLGKIVDAYKQQKRVVKKPVQKEISEEEKQYWMNKAVLGRFEYFQEHGQIEDNRTDVYQILDDDGYLSKDVEFKKEMLKSAQELLSMENAGKKGKTREEHKSIQTVLELIKNDRSELVKNRAKKMIVEKFFRELLKDEVATNEFIEKYS